MTKWEPIEYWDCNNCYWGGTADELVCKDETDKVAEFIYCPGCGGTDFNIEDDDE